jgi:hypothetical protein
LPLLPQANEVNTRDGIAAGGARLAAEVRDVASQHGSLTSLSLVGNSLGGLYVRYAAAELLDDDSERCTMAGGLTPDALVTTGAPHLGVRKYTFLPLPEPLFVAGRAVAGQTAEDLLLRDARHDEAASPLLLRMSEAASPFGRALRAFRRRRLCTPSRAERSNPAAREPHARDDPGGRRARNPRALSPSGALV